MIFFILLNSLKVISELREERFSTYIKSIVAGIAVSGVRDRKTIPLQ